MVFEKLCSSETPLYLNFDEALETERNHRIEIKNILIISSYCEDLARYFLN